MGQKETNDEPTIAVKGIYTLLAKAADSHDGNEAMKFSQAALNASNAVSNLSTFRPAK